VDFVVQPSDLQNFMNASRAIDANPLRVAGRLAGLGAGELEAGIPTWAWVLVAFGAGAAAGFVLRPLVSKKLGVFGIR
jgi:hypothetical protein